MPPDQPRWTEYLPLRDLKPHPDNPKGHAIAEIRASIRRFGYVEHVILDERTGLLLGGHGRTETVMLMEAERDELPRGVLMNDDGAWMIPVDRGYASTDDEEALALIVALNRHVEQGGWLPDRLGPALEELHGSRGLDGIGYTPADLDLILADLHSPQQFSLDAEWVGMPEFVQEYKDGAYKTTIHFPTLEDAQRFWSEVLKMGEPRRMVWWPEHDGHVGYLSDTIVVGADAEPTVPDLHPE